MLIMNHPQPPIQECVTRDELKTVIEGLATPEDVRSIVFDAFEGFAQIMNDRFEKVDARFEKLEESIDKRFAQVDARFLHLESHMNFRFEDLENRMHNRFDKVEKKFDLYLSKEEFAPYARKIMSL